MSKTSVRSLASVGIAVVLGAGLALSGGQHGWTIAGIPGFALAVAFAFLVQWIAFVPAAIARTDRYFDATGSLTYIVVTVALLVASPGLDARGALLGGMVILWALRLGTFLLVRNVRAGGDERFSEIRGNALRFFSVWTIQGIWVSLTAAAAWIVICSAEPAPVTWLSIVGVAVWVIGFVIEAVADEQKRRFRGDPANAGRFIHSGLWSVVRHPNYLGEITLWVGVLLVAAPALHGWQWVALLSPLFVILLLTRVSGIPLLEAKAQRTWGDDREYRAYVARTPALLPGLRG